MDIKDFEQFPPMSKYTEEIQEHLPHFVFYRKQGKDTDCYCTFCHQRYIDSPFNRSFQPQKCYKHNEYGVCINCGESVQFKAMDRGRKTYRHSQNFAVFHAIRDTIMIRCFRAYQYFEEDIMEPDFDLVEKVRYIMEPGKAVQFYRRYQFPDKCGRWYLAWAEKNSPPVEPVFSSGNFGYPADRTYTVINDGCLLNTFLKYSVSGLDDPIENNFITYICMIAAHPNIEYMIKSGFGYIISRKLNGGRTGIRINYRSNDVKRMLRLNKSEMNLLKDRDCETLSAYYTLRKKDPAMDENTRFQAARSYKFNIDILLAVMNKTGLSLKKVLNYADKHEGHYRIRDWNDYLDQCIKLKYDMTDTLITKPKNLHEAHERLTKIIKIEVDKLAQQELEERSKKLAEMEYIDEERGLQIVIPKSVQEIVDEGKRLNHCVGGYAQRHAEGKLTILFLRTTEKPDVPYYTMEVNTGGRIVQCRGYKNNCANNPKPQDIIDFEKEYQMFLDTIFGNKIKKQRIKLSA